MRVGVSHCLLLIWICDMRLLCLLLLLLGMCLFSAFCMNEMDFFTTALMLVMGVLFSVENVVCFICEHFSFGSFVVILGVSVANWGDSCFGGGIWLGNKKDLIEKQILHSCEILYISVLQK